MKNTGIDLIAQERKEQIVKHGRTIVNDIIINDCGQLINAARKLIDNYDINTPPNGWDEALWLRMILKPYKERLIIAGALIAAELDRIEAINSGFKIS